MNATNTQQKSFRAEIDDIFKTFTKEGFYDEHDHYVSWLWVMTDIIPVKTKENVFMTRCNIVTRLQKMLSQAVTSHFHCRMWGEGDKGTMSPIKLSFIQTSSSLEGPALVIGSQLGLVSWGGISLWLAAEENTRLWWWASILGWHQGDKFKIIMSLVRQHCTPRVEFRSRTDITDVTTWGQGVIMSGDQACDM